MRARAAGVRRAVFLAAAAGLAVVDGRVRAAPVDPGNGPEPVATAAAAGDASVRDRAEIRAALERWTAAFNARDADGACDLFSADAIAVFPGGPDRGHAAICASLAAALADRVHSRRYSFELEEILVSGDLAVVRLIWTLRTEPPSATDGAVARERGVDVFRREAGGWKILRSTAFPADGPGQSPPAPSPLATAPRGGWEPVREPPG